MNAPTAPIEAKPETALPVAVPSSEVTKTVKPVNEEARAKAAATRVKNKLAKAMKGAKNADEIFAAVERVKNGAPEKEEPAKAAESVAVAKAGVTPEEIAAAYPVVLQLWGGIAQLLDATPYGPTLNEPREVRVQKTDAQGNFEGAELVKVDPVGILAQGTAPLYAKYMGASAGMSPEAAAAITVLSVFGPPTVAIVAALVQAKFFSETPTP